MLELNTPFSVCTIAGILKKSEKKLIFYWDSEKKPLSLHH